MWSLVCTACDIFVEEKKPIQQEKYKRLGELMSRDEVRQATALLSASGREALRGRENRFGSLAKADSHDVVLFDNFARILQTYHEGVTEKVILFQPHQH